MTHNETRISNERLIAEATEMCRHPNVHFHYSDGPRVMMTLVQALRSTNVEAEPISWLSFNDGSEPYLTGNQAEMIKLEATGPGPHALYAHPLPNPSPSDGEVSREQAIACMAVELAHYKSMHGVNIRTGRKLVMRERARAERAEAELARKTEALEQTEIERDNCIDAAKASWSKHGAMEMAKGQWQFRALAAEAKAKSLQEALTPSGDTKAAYIGEFKFVHTVWDPDGEDEIDHHITVPWTTIKEIMAAIAARSALEEKTDV